MRARGITQYRAKGFLALLGAAILFGSTGAFVNILSNYFTEPGQLIVRSVIAVMMVVALARLFRIRFAITKDQVKYLVAVAVLYALSTSCFVYAVTSVKASTALFMLYVGVIVVTQVIGSLMFREKFGRKNIVALVILGAALVLYMQPISAGSLSFGLLIAFVGGACEALSYAVRKGKDTLTKESVTAAQMLGGLVIGAFFLSVQPNPIVKTELSVVPIILMIVLGAIYVGIGYLITYGMRHYSLGMGSVVLSSDMLFALVINTIFLGQSPTGFEIVGSMLIFACIIYTTDFSEASTPATIEDDDEDEPPDPDRLIAVESE